MQIYILISLLQKFFKFLAFVSGFNIKINILINLFLLFFIYTKSTFCKYMLFLIKYLKELFRNIKKTLKKKQIENYISMR